MARSWGLLLAAAAVVCATASRGSVTPIAQVLQMMKDMKVKAIADKKDEEVKFSSFTQWCADVTKDKLNLIKKAKLELEDLAAKIDKATSDIEDATSDINKLDEDMEGYQKDEQAATAVRTTERADFDAELASYNKALDQLDRAFLMLRELSQTTPTSAAMLQKHLGALALSGKMPEHAQKVMTAFLQEVRNPENEGLNYEAPEAHAYIKQSGGVQEMLLELKYKFQEEKTNLEATEMNRRYAYQMVVQKLTDQGEGATREKGVKTAFKAKRSADKAEDEGDYSSTATTKKADEEYLEDTTTLCKSKTNEFASRSKLRDEEIEALTKAIEIIGSDAVSERTAAQKYLDKPALAHLRSVSSRNPKLEQVASFLKEKATMYKNKELALLAEKALADPFAKVKAMIKALLMKLMEEASAEGDHKAYCKSELQTNELTRKYKSENIEKLHTDIEDLTAQIGQLSQDIEDLASDISDIEKSMAEATQMRKDEKAENMKTIAEAKEGQEALAQAIAVIRDYYAKAAEATALAQQTPGADAPVTWDSPFKGQQDTATGVFGLLDVIRDDFLRQETSTDVAEDKAQLEYERNMQDSSKTKAVKETEMGHKTNKRTTKEGMLQSTKESLTETQQELTAALDYYEKLKPTCVTTGFSYEERVKSRLAELESLKEAYQILSGEQLPSLSQMKAESVGLEY